MRRFVRRLVLAQCISRTPWTSTESFFTSSWTRREMKNSRINATSISQPDLAKSESEIIIQLFLVVALFLSSLAGNLSICVLLLRFKRLRTIPNLFIGNLCTVNLVSTTVNLPLLVVDNVLMSREFVGKTASRGTVFLYMNFIILNVYSMVLMMLDRYAAIAFGMAYKVWISKLKAFIGIGIVWAAAVVVSTITLLLIWEIDLGDQPVHVYRKEYFKTAVRYCFLINVVLSVVTIIVLSLLTFQTIKIQTMQISSVGSSTLERGMASRSTEQRFRNKSIAVKNILLITVTYILCFIPGIIFTAFTDDIRNKKHYWRIFFIPLCIFFSYVVDPVVIISRSQSLMKALRNFYTRSRNLSQDTNVVMANGNLKSNSVRSQVPRQLLSANELEQRSNSLAPGDNRIFERTLKIGS